MLHLHPSVNALLAVDGETDAIRAIRNRARALVAEARDAGWHGPPFDMIELASFRGLRVQGTWDLTDDQDACVTPGLVLINARKPLVRRRYSLAHEVGHTLFPDYEAELRRVRRMWRRETDNSEFERLCQAAAAEFLMPLDTFQASIAAHGDGLAGVVHSATAFGASVEAAARRRVETADEPMAALFLRPRDPTTGEVAQKELTEGYTPYAQLAVSLVCANESCACFETAWGAAPPKDGTAERAWKRAALAHGKVSIYQHMDEDWTHAGVEGRWIAEAMSLPKAVATPYEVLCLVRATKS